VYGAHNSAVAGGQSHVRVRFDERNRVGADLLMLRPAHPSWRGEARRAMLGVGRAVPPLGTSAADPVGYKVPRWLARADPTSLVSSRPPSNVLTGGQVGQIADPQTVRRGRGEVPIAKIGSPVRRGIGDRGPPRLPAPLRPGCPPTHQPGHPVMADLLALAAELVPHPWVAPALEVLLVHSAHPHDRPLVLDAASRALTGARW
jgi:hypothetical protein